jgi:hypothetical protein
MRRSVWIATLITFIGMAALALIGGAVHSMRTGNDPNRPAFRAQPK